MTSPRGLLSLSQQNRTTLSEPELDSAVLSNAYGAGPSLSQESSELFSFFPILSHIPDYIFKTTNWVLASFSLIKKYVVDILLLSFSSMCLTYSLCICASEFFPPLWTYAEMLHVILRENGQCAVKQTCIFSNSSHIWDQHLSQYPWDGFSWQDL